MRMTYERQRALQRRARHLGGLAPRCTEVVGGYTGGVALYCREAIPLWDVVIAASGGFLIVLSFLLMQLRGGPVPAVTGAREWSRALLDGVPGWRRLDDVPIAGSDDNHVVATPAGLLLIVARWCVGPRDADGNESGRHGLQADLALAATAARRLLRMTTVAPNPLKVPVYGALLQWGPVSSAVKSGWDEAAGAFVLDANQPWSWPAELTVATASDADLRPAQVDEALRKVSGWVAGHERRLAVRRLTRILLTEVRRGLGDHRTAVSRREERTLARTLLANSR
jgi:hypothetical protein